MCNGETFFLQLTNFNMLMTMSAIPAVPFSTLRFYLITETSARSYDVIRVASHLSLCYVFFKFYCATLCLLSAGVCPSVCLSRSRAVSRQLRISSNFFLGRSHIILIAKHSTFLTPSAGTQIPRQPSARASNT